MDFFFFSSKPKYLWDNFFFLFYIVVTGYVRSSNSNSRVLFIRQLRDFDAKYISNRNIILEIIWYTRTYPKNLSPSGTVAITSDYPSTQKKRKKESFSHNLNKTGYKFSKKKKVRDWEKVFHIFFLLYCTLLYVFYIFQCIFLVCTKLLSENLIKHNGSSLIPSFKLHYMKNYL